MEHADRISRHFEEAQKVQQAFLADPACLAAVEAGAQAMAQAIGGSCLKNKSDHLEIF